MRIGLLAENLGAFPAGMPMTAAALMKHSGHNLGNFAFWHASAAMLAQEPVLVPFRARAEDYLDRIDALVIAAANWLNGRQDFGWLADLIEGLDVPVVVLGLGAQADEETRIPELTPGSVRFLQAAAAHGPDLAVRGPFSAEVCRAHGVDQVAALGCPSLFLNPDPELGRKVAARWAQLPLRVAQHACTTRPASRAVERALFAATREEAGRFYVCQAPLEWLRVYLAEQRPGAGPAIEALHRYLAPELAFADFAALLRFRTQVPHSIPAWLHLLRGCSHTLNTRIHGSMIALAAGVPTLCLTHDTRTRELCQRLAVPAIAVDQVQSVGVEELFASTAFDGEAFDANRAELAARYRELFAAVQVPLGPRLPRLAA